VNVFLDPADFLPAPKCRSFSVVNFPTQFVCPGVRAVGQNSPFFSAHIFSSCRGPSCASVCIPVPPVRYFSASILLPPISPGLVRVCTILFLSCMNSPAQNLLRLRLQWAPAGPSGAQSSRQERAPAPSLLVQDTQVSPTLQCS
jgi:hypothetical protein